jgi:hypothetical protein
MRGALLTFWAALAVWLSAVSGPALAADAVAAGSATDTQQVNAFIDEWHDDAAHARLRFFDKMAPGAIYIGTDKTERWTRDELKAWSKKYFERPSAWAFTPIKRNVAFSADKQFIWFDEQLDTQMGVCQASGVVQRTASGLQILHYQLSLAVPNELVDQFTDAIRKAETKK